MLSTKNMDGNEQRAINKMNVSYPISCFGSLPPRFFGYDAYDATLSYGQVICLVIGSSLCGISWHCRFNFGF